MSARHARHWQMELDLRTPERSMHVDHEYGKSRSAVVQEILTAVIGYGLARTFAVRPPVIAIAPAGRCGRGFDCRQPGVPGTRCLCSGVERMPALLVASSSCREWPLPPPVIPICRRGGSAADTGKSWLIGRGPVSIPSQTGLSCGPRARRHAGRNPRLNPLSNGAQLRTLAWRLEGDRPWSQSPLKRGSAADRHD